MCKEEYDGFRSGVVAESGARGLDIGRKFGFVEGLFWRRDVLLRNDVVDRLFHLLLFFIYTPEMQLNLKGTHSATHSARP